jgi:hypothetical protein
MTDIRRIAELSVASYQAAIQQEMASFQQAKIANDELAMVESANRIASYRAAANQVPQMYAEAMNPAPAAPPTNKYGLTAAEAEVARNWSQDPSLSEHDKMQTYAEQKNRYRHMRQTGEYDDSQGRVFKR